MYYQTEAQNFETATTRCHTLGRRKHKRFKHEKNAENQQMLHRSQLNK